MNHIYCIYIYISKDCSGLIQHTYNIYIQYTYNMDIWIIIYTYIKGRLRTCLIYIQYRHTIYVQYRHMNYIYIYISKDFSWLIEYTYNIDNMDIWIIYIVYIYIKGLFRTYTIYIQYRHTIYIQYRHMNYYIYTYIKGRLRTCSIYIQYRHTIYV